MEIIGIAIVQLLFLAGCVALFIFIGKKLPKDDRPASNQDKPALLGGIQNIINKIPGLSETDKEINADKGTFYTTAPLSNVWERLIEVMTRHPIHPDPRYQWKDFKVDEPYNRIQMRAGWSETQRYVGPPGGFDTNQQYTCTVTCSITLEDLASGGTAVHFEHSIYNATLHNFDLMASKIKRDTNDRLRIICLQMTQDPNRGMPF